jgi:hypothetical protein
VELVHCPSLWIPLRFGNWFCFHFLLNRMWKNPLCSDSLIWFENPAEWVSCHILFTWRRKYNQFPKHSYFNTLEQWAVSKIIVLNYESYHREKFKTKILAAQEGLCSIELVQSNDFSAINFDTTVSYLSYNEFAMSVKYVESQRCNWRLCRVFIFLTK